MSVKSEKRLVEQYMAEHELESVVNEVLNVCLRERPDDPFSMLGKLLKERSKAGKGVLEVNGRLVLDCEGGPSVEIELLTENGSFRAQVGSAALKSAFVRLQGDDFLQAVAGPVRKAVQGKDPAEAETLDQVLLALDEQENKANVGSNTLLAASIAAFRAGAASRNLRLFEFVAQVANKKEFAIPVPWVTAVVLSHERVGILPTGAETLREGVEACQAVLGRLAREHGTLSKGGLREAMDRVVAIVEELGLQDVVRLAVSVYECDLVDEPEPSKDAALLGDAAAAEEATGQTVRDGADKSAAAGDGAAEAKEDGDAADGALLFDRKTTLDVVEGLLEDEALAGWLVIAENLFAPGAHRAMERFVEDHGDTVVLFNHVAESASAEDDLSVDGAADAAAEDAAEGKTDDATAEEKDGGDTEGKEGGDTNQAAPGGNKADDDEDSDLPPCNGDRLYVGVPSGELCTVTDLVQECELFQTQGQAVVVVLEEAHGTPDTFPAEFAVAMGTGLIRVGSLNRAASATQVNYLLRMEEQLGADAFYAASRFRSPF